MFINKNIKSTNRVFPMQGRYGYYRFDMNENPEGLPKDFVVDVLKNVTPEFLSIYPEPDRFLRKYAKYIGTDVENVLATNGSDMAIRYLLETFGESGKEVVTASPSFEMYWVNCKILGLKHVPVPYESDLTFKVENILKAITNDTRIIVLLNPNNPIGNVYSLKEVQKIIKKAETVGALVIIDEAYHYFYDGTFINMVFEHDNVAVLRTFSKLFSLAACRLGVIIASKGIIDYVKKAKLTFDVNSIALLFGEKIIGNDELEKRLIDIEKEGKKFILESLSKRNYECRDCRGNFIFVVPRHDSELVAKRLEQEEHVLVKTFSNPFLKKYLRVSIGSKESMKVFLKAFLKVDK